MTQVWMECESARRNKWGGCSATRRSKEKYWELGRFILDSMGRDYYVYKTTSTGPSAESFRSCGKHCCRPCTVVMSTSAEILKITLLHHLCCSRCDILVYAILFASTSSLASSIPSPSRGDIHCRTYTGIYPFGLRPSFKRIPLHLGCA